MKNNKYVQINNLLTEILTYYSWNMAWKGTDLNRLRKNIRWKPICEKMNLRKCLKIVLGATSTLKLMINDVEVGNLVSCYNLWDT